MAVVLGGLPGGASAATPDLTTVYNSGTRYFAAGGLADGTDDASASGQSVAIGASSSAANVGGHTSVAIGKSATTTYGGSVAVGESAFAGGGDSTAIGRGASTVSVGGANNQIALGTFASTGALGAIALGGKATASAQNAIAFGASSSATAVNSVALGAGSTTTADLTAAGYNPGSMALSGVASTANGEVSVGSAGNERRVTNVAAGSAATDAVNVSQLQSEAAKSSAGISSLSTGLDTTISAVGSLSTSTAAGLSSLSTGLDTAIGNVASLSTSTATGLSSLSTGLSTTIGAVESLSTGVSSLSTGVANSVQYDNAEHTSVTLGGVGSTTPVTLTNVADGVNPLDAVNVGQLTSLSTSTASGLRSLSTGLDTIINNVASLSTSTATGLSSLSTGLTTTINTVESLSTGVSSLSTSLTTTSNALASLSTGVTNSVQYDNAEHTSVTLGGVGSTTPVTLTNIADGVNPLDAVNVSQLTSLSTSTATGLGALSTGLGTTITNVASLSTSTETGLSSLSTGLTTTINTVESLSTGVNSLSTTLTTTNSALASLSTGVTNSVQYDNAERTSVTLGGAGSTTPVTLTNIADGVNPLDAVNVSQLTSLSTSTATGLSSLSTGLTTTLNTVESLSTGVSSLSTSLTTTTNALASLSTGVTNSVQYDNPDHTSVTLGGAGSTTPVTLTNIADGVNPLDAVNVSQLSSLSTSTATGLNSLSTGLTTTINTVESLSTGVSSLSTTLTTTSNALASLSTGVTNSVQYDDADHTSVTLGGLDVSSPVALHNVKAGELTTMSTDAVNGSQLYATASSAAAGLGGGATVNADGSIIEPSYSVGGKTVHNVGDAITNIDGRVTDVQGSVTNLTQQLNSGEVGLVKQDANTNAVTVASDKPGTLVDFTGSEGARTLRGVQAGELSATSTDAVNGSQLFATDARVTKAESSIAQNTTDITSLQNQLSSGSIGLVQQDPAGTITVGASTGGMLVSMAGTDGNRRVTGVADGVSTYDAVNVGQLSALQSQLQTQVTNLGNQVTKVEQGVGSGGAASNAYWSATAAPSTPGIVENTATPGAGEGSIAAGYQATASGDYSTAVGANSSAADHAVAMGAGAGATSGSVAVGQGAQAAGANSVALGQSSVADRDNSVSVGSSTQQRQITNVAAGTEDTDAVNLGQLNSQISAAVGNLPPNTTAKDYTDQRISQVQGQINDVARNAYSGIAAATALTMIPEVDQGKTLSFGIGASTYKGYQAVALGGTARITQNIKMKAGVGMSGGGTAVGVGASYQW